jgi:hypothetical protein
MSKPIRIASKSVFAPRGTATYTPKWSIVVLALACLGVLKFYGPGEKTPALRETRSAVSASFLPTIENKGRPSDPPPAAPGAVIKGHPRHHLLATPGKGEVTTGSNHLGFRWVKTDDEKSKN